MGRPDRGSAPSHPPPSCTRTRADTRSQRATGKGFRISATMYAGSERRSRCASFTLSTRPAPADVPGEAGLGAFIRFSAFLRRLRTRRGCQNSVGIILLAVLGVSVYELILTGNSRSGMAISYHLPPFGHEKICRSCFYSAINAHGTVSGAVAL